MTETESYKLPRVATAAALACAALILAGPCLAQATGPLPEDSLNKLEMKMFARGFGHDPVEKRVERLELMIFGGVQVGSLGERWQRINSALSEREKEHASRPSERKAAPGQATPPAPGHYPALDSLEWRILKKTYKDEAIADRLSRLETKLLGQPNQALSHADRVERLKKMVTAGDSARSGTAQIPRPPILGPMPRALPRMMPDGSPFMSPFAADPYGSDDMNKMLSDMFEHMNKQMQDLRNAPPGSYSFKFGPNFMPGVPRKNGIPDIFSQPPTRIPPSRRAPEADLPPYYDPNSI